ncbi:hypothetical protein KXS12_21400 [Priestia filamentosa]|uniref:hypothetical protein n=1 Tax=Priestia filamentosa TaxID=1402861 RepID=UPI003F18CEEF
MHSTKIISSADFSFSLDGHPSSLEEVFPGFHTQDRIGIVVRRPGGATGASGLLMATIARFYDSYRSKISNKIGKLRIYPECFIFHVGRSHGNHADMDVWPPHREVMVEDDPEKILEAINDRGITRLIVEDTPPLSATFLRETISSAEHRILSTIAYSTNGRVENADVSVTTSRTIEKYVLNTLRLSRKFFREDEFEHMLRVREGLTLNGQVTETYRRINLSDAMRMLSLTSRSGSDTRRIISISAPNASIVLT